MATRQHDQATTIHLGSYWQAGDPGAVGAGKTWLDRSTVPATLRVRNAANTGWDAVTVGAAGALEVTDGTTDLGGIAKLHFIAGAVVSAGAVGEADVTVTPGGTVVRTVSFSPTINPTPAAITDIAGVLITVPARAVARAVLVSVSCILNPTHCALYTRLDGAVNQLSNLGAADSSGDAWQGGSQSYLIPGDNATHDIALQLAARGSVAATTFTGGHFTVIDPAG